ncbi:MAG: hypothetical protein QM800_07055 [Paludibacter sp.]
MKAHLYIFLVPVLLFMNANTYSQNKISLGEKLNLFRLKLDQFLGAKYQPGAAMLTNGDTLIGAFEFNDSEENYRTLYYIDPLTREKKVYEPSEVKYFYLDSIVFQPVESNDGLVFMRIVLSDKLKVYFHKHFITTFTGGKVVDQFYCEKPTGERLVIPNDGAYPFNARAGKFFSDCPELYRKIRNYTYGYKDFYKIIEEYNDWLKRK